MNVVLTIEQVRAYDFCLSKSARKWFRKFPSFIHEGNTVTSGVTCNPIIGL